MSGTYTRNAFDRHMVEGGLEADARKGVADAIAYKKRTGFAQCIGPELQHFEPGIYIELDDVFSGARKMARVDDSGTGYFDLEDDRNGTPFGIYDSLHPVEVGNILGWGLLLVDQRPAEHGAFTALVDQLIQSGADVLTYNRAAYWAFSSANYDFERALAQGYWATELVRTARKRMDQIVTNALAAGAHTDVFEEF